MIDVAFYGEISSKLEIGYDNTMQRKYQYCFIKNDGKDYEVRFYPCLERPAYIKTDNGKVLNRFNGYQEFNSKGDLVPPPPPKEKK